jgi:release factor glutamine methyltransferase
MPSVSKRVFFGDLKFDVCEEVYEPAEDSFLFAENLFVNAGERVLDVGTGTGVLGIVAAGKASEVLAVDVNPYAVQCAKWNASLNKVRDRMAFARADLFSALKEVAQFDVILFNAPYLPSAPSEMDTWMGRAWAGGVSGRQVIDRFIVEAPQHLTRKGRVLMMQSTLAGVEETQRRFADCGLLAEVMAEQKLPFFEVLTLLKAVFKS